MKHLITFSGKFFAPLLGLVFLLSAFSKIHDLAAFQQTLQAISWLPRWWQGLTVLFLPGLELTLAFSLLTGWSRRESGLIALILLMIFLMYSVHLNLAGGGSRGCGCMKIAAAPWFEFKSWWMVLRNAVLTLLAYGAWWLERKKGTPVPGQERIS